MISVYYTREPDIIRDKWHDLSNSIAMFVINCKNYKQVAGANDVTHLIHDADEIASTYGIEIIICPPQHMAGLGAIQASKTRETWHGGRRVSVFAQHIDGAGPGNTTGFVVAELLKKVGVAGALVNHSEHRIPAKQIHESVKTLKSLDMTSIVCVRDVVEAHRYSTLNPDYIAIEPPELIGTGRAISKERPDLIQKAAHAVRNASGGDTGLLCGAGIVSGQDVTKALQLGSNGILVASGIVKADDWSNVMAEFAKAMVSEDGTHV